jgi:hypothetical protein
MHLSSPDPARRRALERAMQWDEAKPVLMVALAVILGIGGSIAFHRTIADDLAGAPIRHAQGVVTIAAHEAVDDTNLNPNQLTTLAVDGQPLILDKPFGSLPPRMRVPVRVGSRVRYGYRVGKSGRWYLEEIEPLPPSRAPD